MNLAKWKDGVYRVECGSFRGDFTISNGHLVKLEPCLRKNFDVFAKHAKLVEEPKQEEKL
jgi:hypothetical protein